MSSLCQSNNRKQNLSQINDVLMRKKNYLRQLISFIWHAYCSITLIDFAIFHCCGGKNQFYCHMLVYQKTSYKND